MESYDFSGKKLACFATSGGSGLGNTTEDLKSVCPDAIWCKGLLVNGMSARQMENWANSI